MTKFSGTKHRPLRANLTAPVHTLRQRTLTHEGGAAYVHDPESELFVLAATNMVGEGTFYEHASDRDARFVDLVHQVTATNPAFIAGADPGAGKVGLAQYLRESMLMRSAAVVMAAEYVKAGEPFGHLGASAVGHHLPEGGDLAEIGRHQQQRHEQALGGDAPHPAPPGASQGLVGGVF